MALTHAEITTAILLALDDASAAIYTATVTAQHITKALRAISGYVPFEPASHDPESSYIFTETLPDGARTFAMSTALKQGLIKVPQYQGVEYETEQDPPAYRNHEQNGGDLTLLIDDDPSEDKDVLVYPFKFHILQSAIGTTTTTGAVKTAGTLGDTSLALKSLGTGTINENTTLTIAGHPTSYTVVAKATIAAAEATVYIWPPLTTAILADAVVTLALHDSTLTPDLEEALIDWVVADLHLWRANALIPETDQQKAWDKHVKHWQNQLALVKQKLNGKVDTRKHSYIMYPRS